MKLLLVTEFFPDSKAQFSGGVEARVFFLSEYLEKHQEIQVISRPKSHIQANTSSLWPRLRFIVSAIKRGLAADFDVVEGSNHTVYLSAYLIGLLKNKPRVAWIADIYGRTWFRDFDFLPALSGYVLEKTALALPWQRIIAMSQSTKSKLVKAGVPESRIRVVYGGVDVAKLQGLKVAKYSRPTITTLARLVNYKRIDDLIRAVALIQDKHPDLQVRVLGDGPERASLENLAAELELKNKVKFMGNQPHGKAMRILKRSTLFSLPSIVEGFGLVTVEAMAAGVPYVNSAIPPTREITREGLGGELFEPQDIGDYSRKIDLLLNNKKRYTQKQQEGLALVKDYDWQTINKQTLAIYKQVVAL